VFRKEFPGRPSSPSDSSRSLSPSIFAEGDRVQSENLDALVSGGTQTIHEPSNRVLISRHNPFWFNEHSKRGIAFSIKKRMI
jgi:hypothetical protein